MPIHLMKKAGRNASRFSYQHFIYLLLLYITLPHHGMCHFHEARDICAFHVIDISIRLRAIFDTLLMNITHDMMQTFVDFCLCPCKMHGILAHFKTRSCHAACIYSLARCIDNFVVDKRIDCLRRTSHIRHFCYDLHLVCHQFVRILFCQFVLRSAWKGDINFALPWFLAGKELRTGNFSAYGATTSFPDARSSSM